MTIYYVETKSNQSDRRGPIDPTTGFPTVHPSLSLETDSMEEAIAYFNRLFPGDVLEVYTMPARVALHP